MAKHEVRSLVALVSLAAGLAGPAAAQGTVRGQVSMTERPGEISTDLGSSVVYLQPATPLKQKRSTSRTQMAMQGRQFAPRVAVIPAGGSVEFPNQDPFSHNIFSNTGGGAFDLGLYGRGGSKRASFRKPGVYPVFCNIHARMTGFVLAVATPWYIQPGADGRFSFDHVPAGTYVAHVWHERTPEETREIVVPSRGLDGVDVRLDARGYLFKPHRNKFGQEYTSQGKDRY